MQILEEFVNAPIQEETASLTVQPVQSHKAGHSMLKADYYKT